MSTHLFLDWTIGRQFGQTAAMTKGKPIPHGEASHFESSWSEPHKLTSFEDLIPVRVARITEIFVRIATLAFSDSLGIRVTDLRILNVLHADDEVSVAEISRRARIDKAWISRLVRELEDKGLVMRKPHPTDARTMLVSLTDEGRKIQQALLPTSMLHEQKALGGIDRDAFVEMLDLFERNGLALLMSLERPR